MVTLYVSCFFVTSFAVTMTQISYFLHFLWPNRWIFSRLNETKSIFMVSMVFCLKTSSTAQFNFVFLDSKNAIFSAKSIDSSQLLMRLFTIFSVTVPFITIYSHAIAHLKWQYEMHKTSIMTNDNDKTCRLFI